MTLARRTLLFGAATLPPARPAPAQAFPTRPVRVPQAAQAALTNALIAASTRPEVRAALADAGMEVPATGREPLAQWRRTDTERYAAIARAAGARLN